VRNGNSEAIPGGGYTIKEIIYLSVKSEGTGPDRGVGGEGKEQWRHRANFMDACR